MRRYAAWFLFSALILVQVVPLAAAGRKSIRQTVTTAQVSAVVQAIQDEIYDYDYEAQYENLRSESETGTARIPIYVNPHFAQPGVGDVIYKLLPYGEVDRVFQVGENGLVVLQGDPQSGFPPNGGPSMKTIYLSDRYVTKAKLNWIKRYITISLKPSSQVIAEASMRQKERVGFSDYEYRLKHAAK